MTEKRFTCEVTDTDLCHIETITDNFEMNTFDDVETVTELLNKFSEENKELKQSISDWQGSYDELYEDNLKLEKEIKELKEQLKDCTKKAKEEIRKQKEENAIRWANIGR